MSLLAILKKSGDIIASYDVPNDTNDLVSLQESMNILEEEVNQTITSLLDGVEASENDSSLEDDCDDDDEVLPQANIKRKRAVNESNKKLKTSQ